MFAIARPAGLVAVLLTAATAADAAPFGPASPVGGFGNQPALAQIAGAALDTSGASVIFASADTSGNRRAVAAFAPATAPPSSARGFGPSSGAFDLALGANAAGDVALTFTVGRVAYLVTCAAGRCGSTVRVGTSALKPQSAVAVQPTAGRTIVMADAASDPARLPRRHLPG